MYTKVCKYCGKVFQTKFETSLFCSTNCRSRYYYQEMKKEIEGLDDFIDGRNITIPFVNHSNLVANVAAAREAGLSYGYYMALKRRAE